jgi:hypothetical protein
MPHCSDNLRSGSAARCAVCDGKFGLVRHYAWRTPLCSKNCVDRFRTRRESDRNWVSWLQIAFDQPPDTWPLACHVLKWCPLARKKHASRILHH